MVRKVRSFKKKAQVARAPTQTMKQDTPWIVALVEACILAVVVLYAGFVIHDLTQQLRSAQGAAAGNGGMVAASPTEAFPGPAYFCERDLNICKQELADAANIEEGVSLHYVLDQDVRLVREGRGDGAKQDFWLVKAATADVSTSSVRIFIGSFDTVERLVQKKPFSIKRLTNGLYQFVATADYLETRSEVMGLIDSRTLDFITFTAPGNGQSIAVTTPDISQALITPHLVSDTCVTSSKAIVDRLGWNKETLYQFRKPPTITCLFNEMREENYLEAFSAIDTLSVARDLRSFVLRLQTGQKLRLQLKGSNKPTVTVVP